MSRIFLIACFMGALQMSAAQLRADSVQAPLRAGNPFPVLKGQFLTGRDAVLPQAASGTVAVVAIGFTYQSRFPVEAWAEWYRTAIGARTDVVFFEVPVIGGLAKLSRWFIDRGMRNGTPPALHERVITVYGGADEWKQRLAFSPSHEDDAYLVVLDREGVVRWLHRGAFEQAHSVELQAVLTSLADLPERRGEP
jgi:hypothetical protein